MQSADENLPKKGFQHKKNSKMFSIFIVIVNNTFLVEKNPINILQTVIRVYYVNKHLKEHNFFLILPRDFSKI